MIKIILKVKLVSHYLRIKKPRHSNYIFQDGATIHIPLCFAFLSHSIAFLQTFLKISNVNIYIVGYHFFLPDFFIILTC